MNLEGFFVVLTWFENVLFKLTRKSFEMKTGCLQLWGSGCHDNISWRISNISGQKVSMTEQKLFSDLCCDAVYGHSSSFRCSVILKWKPWRPHRQILSLERSLWPLIGWQGVTGVWDEGVGLSGGWWWVFLSMYGKVQGVGFNHGGGCCWIPEKAEEQERAEAGSSWSPDMPPLPPPIYLPTSTQHSFHRTPLRSHINVPPGFLILPFLSLWLSLSHTCVSLMQTAVFEWLHLNYFFRCKKEINRMKGCGDRLFPRQTKSRHAQYCWEDLHLLSTTLSSNLLWQEWWLLRRQNPL